MQGPLTAWGRMPWKALARILGAAATLAALAFWAQRVWGLIAAPGAVGLGASSLRGLVAAALVYWACQFLLVAAWQRLLNWFGAGASFRTSMAACGKTLIAKYLPGNIFHFAGRHLAAAEYELPHAAVLGSTFYEILGMGVSAAMLGGAGLVSLAHMRTPDGPWIAVGLALLVLLAAAAQYRVTRTSWYRARGFPGRSLRDAMRWLAPAWFCYLLFSVGFGASLVALLLGTGSKLAELPVLLIISASAAAWTAGFITPGAPGGIGVRDAALILMLSAPLGAPRIIIAATLFRVATVLGDLLFYVTASLFVRLTSAMNVPAPRGHDPSTDKSPLRAESRRPQETLGLLSPWFRDIRLAEAAGEIPTGSLVLDLGAGGMSLHHFLPAGCRYYAVDRNPPTVIGAHVVNYLQLDLTDADAHEHVSRWLPAAPDVITCVAFLEHLVDPAAFVGRYAALLRPGGRFVGTTPHPRGRWIHDSLAAVRLASPDAAAEHQAFLDGPRLNSIAETSGGHLTLYRQFLFGLNQVFILEFPGPVSGPER